MSLFGRMFGGGGKKKENSPEDTQSAIQDLRKMEEMLYKKQKSLENKVEEEIKKAKANATKNKRVALQALKAKKRFEAQLRQLDGTLTTIEYQREALENANTHSEVLQTMAKASSAMKNANKNMDVDDLNELMADIQEQNEIAKEISEAISKPIGFGEDIDEDELAKELEDLQQEELDEDMLNVTGPTTSELPDVPNAEPKKSIKTRDDEELDKLAMWGME